MESAKRARGNNCVKFLNFYFYFFKEGKVEKHCRVKKLDECSTKNNLHTKKN